MALGKPQNSPLQTYLAQNGRFPLVTLQVKPIDPSRPSVELKNFTDYSFQSSVLTPVESFEFKFRNPTLSGSLLDYVEDGDIAILKANGTIISTGIIDVVDILTDTDNGEVVVVQGRNFMAQLEDQSAINDADGAFFGGGPGGKGLTIDQVIDALVESTRIDFYREQQTPTFQPGFLPMFATEPGESKLSALYRYLEPLNCIAWSDPDGTLVVGKPDMGSQSLGSLILDRVNRTSNVLSMRARFASTQIPNIILPLWSGQENVQNLASVVEQAILNNAAGPKRLLGFSHRVPKSVVISTPQGADPQALAEANQFALVGGANVLQAYAKRELARANVNEVSVQVVLKGHYNSNLDPFLIDTCYQILYPRANLDEVMYLHTVEYSMDERQGQRTSLFFCRLGCIVADTSLQSQKASSQKTQVSQ